MSKIAKPKFQDKQLAMALAAITANLPNLIQGARYTLEQLTGDAFWSSLTSGQKKGLGIKFKRYVTKHSQPVRWVGATSTHCQLYQLP